MLGFFLINSKSNFWLFLIKYLHLFWIFEDNKNNSFLNNFNLKKKTFYLTLERSVKFYWKLFLLLKEKGIQKKEMQEEKSF